MVEVSMDELRELAARSRRAHGWGVAVVALAMLMLPVLLLAANLFAAALPWMAAIALLLVGGAFLRYAFVAGESRGAFRKLFRDVRKREKSRRVEVRDAAREKETDAQPARPRGA